MIKYFRKTLHDHKLKELYAFRSGSWIFLTDPDEADVNKLADIGLDKSLIYDALDPFEVPRLETEKDQTYFFTRFPFVEDLRLSTTPLLIVINSDYIATVSKDELPFIAKFVTDKTDINTTQKTKLFLQIFREINNLYSDHLIQINKQVRKISGRPGKVNDKDILEFVGFEETLNIFISDLQPTANVLKNVISGKVLKLFEEDKDLVEDILLSTEQLVETCRLNLRTIVNIREAYSTIVTNNLNRVIKLLTVLTIILTIPTIIGSLYGMNVRLPLEGHPHAFWFIIGFTLVISAVVLVILRKSDWL